MGSFRNKPRVGVLNSPGAGALAERHVTRRDTARSNWCFEAKTEEESSPIDPCVKQGSPRDHETGVWREGGRGSE